MFTQRRSLQHSSRRYRRQMTWFRGSIVAVALMVAAAPFVSNGFSALASDSQVSDLDAEFEIGKRALEAFLDEQVDLFKANRDEEIAALTASRDATLAQIDATRDADRAGLDSGHETRLADIDAAHDEAYVRADADFAAGVAFIDALYAQIAIDLGVEGLSDDELKGVFKVAVEDAKTAESDEQDALKARYEADAAAAKADLEVASAAFKAEETRLKDEYSADSDALKVAEELALDTHEIHTDALLDPLEGEKKYWEAEKKAIEHQIGLIYKPELQKMKDKGKEKSQKYIDLNNEYKAEKSGQTVVQRAMIEELKSIIDELKDDQKAIEESIKDSFDFENDALKVTYEADVSELKAALAEAVADNKALATALKADYEAAAASIEVTYDLVFDALKAQQSAFASDVSTQHSRLEDQRSTARKQADATRDAARKADNKAYDSAKSQLDRNHDSDRRLVNLAYDSAKDEAETRYEHAVDRVERTHDRNMDMLASEHFILRQRVRAFLASDGLVPLSEFYDPKSDVGSLFNVTKVTKANRDEYTGAGVQVAMIDTGIVDVAGLRYSNIVIGPDFSFEDADEALRARDGNGHGTHLAGIIVGSDASFVAGDTDRNPERALGVAPGATLVSVKVGAADGAVDVTQVIAAIDWVIAANASGDFDIRVINLAYGTNGTQAYQIDPMSYAVERAWHAGIVVVVAAGNDGLDATRLTNPATNPYVIAVGAGQARNDHELVLSGFSNGSNGRMVDVVAPGRSIVSFRNPGSFADVTSQGDFADATLVRGSGTSQAAAVVTGVVALMIAENPSLTPDQVKFALMDTAKEARDAAAGAGFIQADKAIGANIPSDPTEYTQTYVTSNGSGSVDAARGDVRVTIDGAVLEGEQDIFGNSWTGNSWTGNSWTGNSWTGNSWTGNSWTGNSWTGNSWTGNSWTGNSWTGNSWTGNSWTGNSWTGNSWTGNSWTGNSWTGNSWTGNSWTGNSWTGNSWTGNSWTGNSWTSIGWGT